MAAGRRQGLTKVGVAPLLRTVSGKLHARDQDHEEVHQGEDTSQEGLTYQQEIELGIHDDPVSSGGETSAPSARSSTATSVTNGKSDDLRKPNSKQKRKKGFEFSDIEPELKKPPGKKSRSTFRVPRAGQFEQSQAVKEGIEVNKNKIAKDAPPASSQDIWGFALHSSQTSQKGTKVQFGGKKTTTNIHVKAPTESNGRTAKASSNTKKKSKPSLDTELRNNGNDSSYKSMDDKELEEVLDSMNEKPADMLKDPELRKVVSKKKLNRTGSHTSESPAMDEAELGILLKPTQCYPYGLTSDIPDSSLPDPSAPQEDVDDIDSYMRELPAEAEEGTMCTICAEPVSQDDYWDFWNGRKKTVRNQAAFCHAHKKATAQKEFYAEGLKLINWDVLPKRIKNHRMSLHRILTGDQPSIYRKRYEPLALTGKAAAVPSKRADLSPSKQSKLASYALDDNAVYPGYYGPRGRRLITESVMNLLSKEIKKCCDAVVQTSGPATFVQAVLVPEVAVRLIMEDCECDWQAADEIRERTVEMGVLLNEEIEDSVEVYDIESEVENEYQF